MSETKERKVVRRSVAFALGIASIVLVASLVSTIAVYMASTGNKDNAISSLNSQISSINSQVANLQGQITLLQTQLKGLLNATATSVSVEEISLNLSSWLNRTVVVEGNLTGPYDYTGPYVYAWNYKLSSNGITIGVFSLDGPPGVLIQPVNALVLGAVTGRRGYWVTNLSVPTGPVQYGIEAERIYLL
jgi:hypothetical protein